MKQFAELRRCRICRVESWFIPRFSSDDGNWKGGCEWVHVRFGYFDSTDIC